MKVVPTNWLKSEEPEVKMKRGSMQEPTEETENWSRCEISKGSSLHVLGQNQTWTKGKPNKSVVKRSPTVSKVGWRIEGSESKTNKDDRTSNSLPNQRFKRIIELETGTMHWHYLPWHKDWQCKVKEETCK